MQSPMKTMMMQVLKSSPKFVDSAQEILDIAQQRGCDGIVVGVPTTPNQRLWDSQQDSRIGRRCRNFAYTVAMVAKPTGLHVFIVSERYSTAEASILLEESKLSKKKKSTVLFQPLLTTAAESRSECIMTLSRVCRPT